MTDPDLMAGTPTIRGLRIPVATVVSMVANGMTVEEIGRGSKKTCASAALS